MLLNNIALNINHCIILVHCTGYDQFISKWNQIEGSGNVSLLLNLTASIVQRRLEGSRLYTVALLYNSTDEHTHQVILMSAKFINNIRALVEVEVMPDKPEIRVSIISIHACMVAQVEGEKWACTPDKHDIVCMLNG